MLLTKVRPTPWRREMTNHAPRVGRMTNHAPRPLTDEDLQEILAIWRRIRALRALKANALPDGSPGAWIANAAELALGEEFQRLDAIYRETHPTLPGMDG